MGAVKLTGFTLTILCAAMSIDPRKMRAHTTEVFLNKKWGALEAVHKKITRNRLIFIHKSFYQKMQKS